MKWVYLAFIELALMVIMVLALLYLHLLGFLILFDFSFYENPIILLTIAVSVVLLWKMPKRISQMLKSEYSYELRPRHKKRLAWVFGALIFLIASILLVNLVYSLASGLSSDKGTITIIIVILIVSILVIIIVGRFLNIYKKAQEKLVAITLSFALIILLTTVFAGLLYGSRYVEEWYQIRTVNGFLKKYLFIFDYLEYDLNLIALHSANKLPKKGKSLVIVAKIDDSYHVRIFDKNGNKVIDKGKDEFSPDQTLIQQLEAVFSSSNQQRIDQKTTNKILLKIIPSNLVHQNIENKKKLIDLIKLVKNDVKTAIEELKKIVNNLNHDTLSQVKENTWKTLKDENEWLFFLFEYLELFRPEVLKNNNEAKIWFKAVQDNKDFQKVCNLDNSKEDKNYDIVIKVYCHPFTNHEEMKKVIDEAYAPETTITLWVFGVIAILVLLMFLTNLNYNSLHYFYRDRLSKTYLIKWGGEEIEQNQSLLLKKLHKHHNGPYHLINTTLNVPLSKNPSLSGRGADFFIFSKCYCGAESTGYRCTKHYNKGETELATAMAISGAAASPEMGTDTNPAMSFLMTLLNIRLNLWMPNPDPKQAQKIIFWPLYLFKEFSRRSTENDALLNLSDGGHHENLGIYALLKRRCRLIIVSDAGADEEYQMEDFANLQRKARIDLGININIDMSDLRPDKKNRCTKAYFVKGTIQYPDDKDGILFYIKTTMTGKEPEDLLAYRRKSPSFPDETTADQFFDEDQFESYRKLGELVGENVCSGTMPLS